MKVIFPYEKEIGSNKTKYPDDIVYFSNTKRVGVNIIADYIGDLSLTEYTPEKVILKSIYTIAQFIDIIPKAIRLQIKADEVAGNVDIIDWVFIVSLLKEVDLNNLPIGFIEGLNLMASNPNISLDQTQVNNFLEV